MILIVSYLFCIVYLTLSIAFVLFADVGLPGIPLTEKISTRIKDKKMEKQQWKKKEYKKRKKLR